MSDLKSRITITGEKEYNAAIQEANRTLRVLRSELKAETAELGANATAQDKASAKIKSLQQQIAQQEKIVKNLNEALEKAKTEYADNQEVQDKWEEKLNKARAALAEMKNELEGAEKGVEGFDRGLKDSSQNVEKTAASVYTLKSGLDAVSKVAAGIGNAIGGAFEALKDTVQTAVNEIMGLMRNAWALAGDWENIANTYGGSAESVQRAYRIVQGGGFEFSTFTGGVNKLIANTHAGSKDFESALDTLEALTGLQLDEENFDNHWDYAMSVVEALNRVGDENVRYSLMEKLFGTKKGEGMAEILTKWEGLSLAYQAAANAGLVLNEAEIEATDAAGDAWEWLKTNWDMLKTLAGMKLTIGLNMQGFSENVTTVIQDLADLFRNGVSAEGMKKLGIDIGVVIDDFGTMMDNLANWLQETGASLEENGKTNWSVALGKGLQALGRLLEWLGDHIDDIIALLEKVFPMWLINNGVKAATGETPVGWVEKILQGVFDIAVLKKVLGGGNKTGGWEEILMNAAKNGKGAQEAQEAANAAQAAGEAADAAQGVPKLLPHVDEAAQEAANAVPKTNLHPELPGGGVPRAAEGGSLRPALAAADEAAQAAGEAADAAQAAADAAGMLANGPVNVELPALLQGAQPVIEAGQTVGQTLYPALTAGQSSMPLLTGGYTPLLTGGMEWAETAAEGMQSAAEALEGIWVILDNGDLVWAPVVQTAETTLAEDLSNISPESYQGITMWSMAKNELSLAYLRYIKPLEDWLKDNGPAALGAAGSGIGTVLSGLGSLLMYAGPVVAPAALMWATENEAWDFGEKAEWSDFDASLYGFMDTDMADSAPDGWWQLWGLLDNFDRIWGAGASSFYDNPHLGQYWTNGIWSGMAGEYGFDEGYGGLTAEDLALLAYINPELARTVAIGGGRGYNNLKESIPLMMGALNDPALFEGFTAEWADEWIAANQELIQELESNRPNETPDQGAAIPDGWYESMEVLVGKYNRQGGQNNEDTLPGAVATAIAGALKGAKVVMDGATVGSIVMEYVNEGIAGMITVAG